MREIALREEGREFIVGVCLKTQGGRPAPRIVTLHGSVVGTCFEDEESKVPIHAWSLDTCSIQAPLSVLVDLKWLLPAEDRVTVDKVSAVDLTIQDVEPEAEHTALSLVGATEKVRFPGAIYIPWCLTSDIIVGVRSPRATWAFLQDCTKNIDVSEACTPL